MSTETAISVTNISKAYRIWKAPAARLTSPLLAAAGNALKSTSLSERAAQGYRDFQALKDISFTIKRGESFGLIGRNGSGKSTLLQIIAGTLQPTAGQVHTQGRVAALLELGSGFNPDFTGRENVYLNGAVLGLSRGEIDARFAEIAAFAAIGDFIEQPVKIYSSGMMLRLAFAVQTAVDPDILIIDEALSVGDAPFQAKCFARIRHLQDRGCTILLVSHDAGTIQTFCQQALWLDQGVARAQGSALDVCGAYKRDCARAMGMDYVDSSVPPEPPAAEASISQSAWLNEDRTEFENNTRIKRTGNGQVRLRNFFLQDEHAKRTSALRWDEELTVVYVIGSDEGYTGFFRLGFTCVTLQGVELLSCSDRTHQQKLELAPGGTQVVTQRLRLPLRAGKYSIYAGVFLFPDEAVFPEGTMDYSKSTAADSVAYAAFIEILPQYNLGIHGPVHLDTNIAIQPS